jgi:hypothetical protein
VTLFSGAKNAGSDEDRRTFRLGVTTSLFSDANENDVRAALKA